MTLRKLMHLILLITLVLTLAAFQESDIDEIELPEYIEVEDEFGVFTFWYPEGWVSIDFGGLVGFSSSEEVLLSGEPEEGEPFGLATVMSKNALSAFASDDMSMEEILNVLVGIYVGDMENNELNIVETLEINGREAASVSGVIRDGLHNMVFVIAKIDDGVAIIMITVSDDIDEYVPIAHAIAGKISLPALEVAIMDGDIELPQTITSGDGVLTVKYPEGWVAEADRDSVHFASSREAFDNYVEDFEEGMASGSVYILDLEEWGLETGATPEDAMAAIVVAADGFEISAIDTFEVNGREAALVTIWDVEDGKQFNQVAVLVEEGGVLIAVTIETLDDVDQYVPIARAIAGKISLPALEVAIMDGDIELLQTITSDDGRLTVKIPGDWVAEWIGYNVFFANSQEAFDTSSGEFEEGMASGSVYILDLEEWGLETGASPEDAMAAIVVDDRFDDDEFSAINTFEVNGREAALVTILAIVDGKQWNQVAVLVEEGGVLIMAGIQTLDDVDQYVPIARDIAEQLEFVPDE
jgi:hypothetical protein